MPRAIFIHILKQFRTRKVAAVLEDARQLTIANSAMILDVALREKIQFDFVLLYCDMTIFQSRESKTLIFTEIFGISDSSKRLFHQSYHRGEHLLARQSRPGEIVIDQAPDGWQRSRELEQVLIFVFIAHRTPSGVISILLSSASVKAAQKVHQWPQGKYISLRVGGNGGLASGRGARGGAPPRYCMECLNEAEQRTEQSYPGSVVG